MASKKRKSGDGPGVANANRADLLAADLELLARRARITYARELDEITRDLRLAERCARKGLRRVLAGQLKSGRRWVDLACDAEYRALGECEGAGWLGDALGSECPWRVYHEADVDGERRLTVVSTCERHRCLLAVGDRVRCVEADGRVISTEKITRTRSERMRQGELWRAVVLWPVTAPRPLYVWKIDAGAHRCGFE